MQFHIGVSFTCFRACKGFDGGFEVRVAIRGPDPRYKSDVNITANNELAYAA